MRSKIIFTILAITVLSSIIFTCSPGSFAIQSSPTLSPPGSSISTDIQTRLEPIASQEYWGSSKSDKFHYPSYGEPRRLVLGIWLCFIIDKRR